MTKPRNLRLTRRQSLAGLAALLAAGLPKAASAAGPRVLIAGDSMIAGGFGLYLENALREEHGYSVLRHGKSSTGLARPDFYDWITEGTRLVDEFRPEATVVMFGGNDVQGLYLGRDTWIRWQDEGWSEEYARRVVNFCDVLAPGGQQIFWVGMPVMRSEKFNLRVQRVNTIFRAEMAIRRKALFVDTWPVLANRAGHYADSIEAGAPDENGRRKKVLVRGRDGIHLTVQGAHVLERHVRAAILHTLRDT